MKNVIISLFLVSFAASSTAIFSDPVGEKNSTKKIINFLVDGWNNNLIQIRVGLLKDNKHMEVSAVESNRLSLNQVTRATSMKVIEFLYDHRQYWQNATVTEMTNSEEEEAVKIFENFTVHLQKVHDSLKKNNKTVQAVFATVLNIAIEKQVLPSVKSYFRLFEKYNHYVKP